MVSSDPSVIVEDPYTLLLGARVRSLTTVQSIHNNGLRTLFKESLDMGE